MSHTPLPWRVDPEDYVPGGFRILAEQGPITVCPAIACGEDDRALIVRAVNSHAELVKALQLAKSRLDPMAEEDSTMEQIGAALKSAGAA